MAWYTKKKDEPKKIKVSKHNTAEENTLLNKIDNSQLYAEGGKRPEIEKRWNDEYLICQGGGKQWDTSQGLRNATGKRRNFNSETNLIMPMIINMVAPFAEAPTMEVYGVESGDDEAAEIMNDMTSSVYAVNKFPEQYKKIVEQMVKYGPVIGYVPWNQHWIGGSGPNRWVGEVQTLFMKKSKFFPDPAILDLEERLQECSYINLKERKKLSWFAEIWGEKGSHILEDTEDIEDGEEDEGQDPKQATLITHFHKGVPEFVSAEWKKTFLEKAQQAESDGLPYKAKDYKDMAEGTLKGVHCGYKAGTILLDYIPYIYDDGLYPFVYKVLYADEEQPWGMGEIRNTLQPQIIYNKADEIELGAMTRQGLGGSWYNKGAITPMQKEEYLDSMSQANAMNEVQDIHGIVPKPTVQVPNSIINYKQGKKDVIDTISGNTAILQGISPGANVPNATVKELGARADSRTKPKAKVIEAFMIEFTQLVQNRIIQFYTVERRYRITGDRQVAKIQAEAYRTLEQIASMPQGTPPEEQIQAVINLLMMVKQQTLAPRTNKFNRSMLVRTWDREYDEDGKPMKEEFIPEFDLKARVIDERPTDRGYWTNIVAQARQFGIIGPAAYWETLIEGKLPSKEVILKELEQAQQAQAQAQQAMIQAQQQKEAAELQATQQYGVMKQKMQNDSVEKQVGMKVEAKRGVQGVRE